MYFNSTRKIPERLRLQLIAIISSTDSSISKIKHKNLNNLPLSNLKTKNYIYKHIPIRLETNYTTNLLRMFHVMD